MFIKACIIITILYTIALLIISRKQKLNKELSTSTKELQITKALLEQDISKTEMLLEKAEKKYNQTLQDYSRQLLNRKQELNTTYEELEKEKKNSLNARVANYEKDCGFTMRKAQLELEDKLSSIQEQSENLDKLIAVKQASYEGLIEPLKNLEKDKQAKIFYCIQLNEDDEQDIDYLVEEVVPHIKHPDIMSKLIWSEYIKNPLDATFKRVGITDGPGIYKITNVENGMCYIGKSTNVKKRLQDHFKSVVGIKSISDQKVHHEILKYGISNWMIEQVCECEKEELNEKEKFYISFFNSTEYGYNLRAGG